MQQWGKVAPATAGASDQASRAFQLVLHPPVFACVWSAVACLHIINGVFLGAICSLYWYITTPDMVYFVPTLQLPSLLVLRMIGAVYAALSFCHAMALASMVSRSLHRKTLCLNPARAKRQVTRGNRHVHQLRRNHTMRRAVDASKRWWQCAFSMDSQHFETTFELRETVEIGCQTYQAFYLSRSVSNDWINGLAVATLVFNCVSTTLVQYLQRKRRFSVALSRILCVVLDALLDFISSVVVPLAVFTPYWRAFDSSIHDFAGNITYDEVWYTNAVQENHQLFIVTPLDFVSTLLPHVSLLLCMHTIKRRITQVSAAGPTTEVVSFRRNPSDLHHTTRKRWLPFILCGWGAAVLATHITAQYDPAEVPSCKLHNNAWFSSRFPCAVLDLNCHRIGTTGSEVELNVELDKLSRSTLSLLAVTHCSSLEMPSVIHEFRALDGLIVFNATLIDWDFPEDPGHDRILTLSYLEFIHVNFSSDGVFPSALASGSVVFSDLEIYGSNLNELPEHIDALWPELLTLYIEFTALEIVPDAVFRLEQLQFLSFVGNRIRHLPDDAFTPPHESQLRYLTLSGNPLEFLPPRVSERSLFNLQELGIEHTRIANLPQWTEQWYEQTSASNSHCVAAFGSPWCETDTNTSLGESARSQICSEDAGSSLGLVPVDLIVSQHAVT